MAINRLGAGILAGASATQDVGQWLLGRGDLAPHRGHMEIDPAKAALAAGLQSIGRSLEQQEAQRRAMLQRIAEINAQPGQVMYDEDGNAFVYKQNVGLEDGQMVSAGTASTPILDPSGEQLRKRPEPPKVREETYTDASGAVQTRRYEQYWDPDAGKYVERLLSDKVSKEAQIERLQDEYLDDITPVYFPETKETKYVTTQKALQEAINAGGRPLLEGQVVGPDGQIQTGGREPLGSSDTVEVLDLEDGTVQTVTYDQAVMGGSRYAQTRNLESGEIKTKIIAGDRSEVEMTVPYLRAGTETWMSDPSANGRYTNNWKVDSNGVYTFGPPTRRRPEGTQAPAPRQNVEARLLGEPAGTAQPNILAQQPTYPQPAPEASQPPLLQHAEPRPTNESELAYGAMGAPSIPPAQRPQAPSQPLIPDNEALAAHRQQGQRPSSLSQQRPFGSMTVKEAPFTSTTYTNAHGREVTEIRDGEGAIVNRFITNPGDDLTTQYRKVFARQTGDVSGDATATKYRQRKITMARGHGDDARPVEVPWPVPPATATDLEAYGNDLSQWVAVLRGQGIGFNTEAARQSHLTMVIKNLADYGIDDKALREESRTVKTYDPDRPQQTGELKVSKEQVVLPASITGLPSDYYLRYSNDKPQVRPRPWPTITELREQQTKAKAEFAKKAAPGMESEAITKEMDFGREQAGRPKDWSYALNNYNNSDAIMAMTPEEMRAALIELEARERATRTEGPERPGVFNRAGMKARLQDAITALRVAIQEAPPASAQAAPTREPKVDISKGRLGGRSNLYRNE